MCLVRLLCLFMYNDLHQILAPCPAQQFPSTRLFTPGTSTLVCALRNFWWCPVLRLLAWLLQRSRPLVLDNICESIVSGSTADTYSRACLRITLEEFHTFSSCKWSQILQWTLWWFSRAVIRVAGVFNDRDNPLKLLKIMTLIKFMTFRGKAGLVVRPAGAHAEWCIDQFMLHCVITAVICTVQQVAPVRLG